MVQEKLRLKTSDIVLGSDKNSGPEKVFCQVNLGSKNLLCLNKIWVKKVLGSKTFLVKKQIGPIFVLIEIKLFPKNDV